MRLLISLPPINSTWMLGKKPGGDSEEKWQRSRLEARKTKENRRETGGGNKENKETMGEKEQNYEKKINK